MSKKNSHKVSIVMGSQSDFKVMKICQKILKKLKIKCETKIAVIIAGAGGSAHLPGMISAITSLPVLGVPIESKKLKGLDSLLSIVQMPKGIPVGTFAIGEDGAVNAALAAAAIISISNKSVKKNLNSWRSKQTKSVNRKPK